MKSISIELFKNAWEKEFALHWPPNFEPDYELKESLDKESFISSIEAYKIWYALSQIRFDGFN